MSTEMSRGTPGTADIEGVPRSSGVTHTRSSCNVDPRARGRRARDSTRVLSLIGQVHICHANAAALGDRSTARIRAARQVGNELRELIEGVGHVVVGSLA